jgi:hypothetical protein
MESCASPDERHLALVFLAIAASGERPIQVKAHTRRLAALRRSDKAARSRKSISGHESRVLRSWGKWLAEANFAARVTMVR